MAPRSLKNLDIRTRLLLLCLAVSAPLLAMCSLVIWKEYQGLTQVAQRATTFHDELAVRTIDQWVGTQQEELRALALLPSLRSKDVTLTKQILDAQAHVEHCNGIALYDERGNVIASSAAISPQSTSVKNLDIFNQAVEGKASVSGYSDCPISGRPSILIAQPIDFAGTTDGVLVESFKPQAILKLFTGLSEAKGFVVAITDKNHKVIARTIDHDRFVGKDFSNAKTVIAAGQKNKGTIEVVGIADPIPRTYAFDRVPRTGWLVVTGIPTQAIYGSAHDRLLILILSTVLAGGLSVSLAYAFTGHFTIPIHELVREAVSIGRGDLSKRVNSLQGGELGLLARAFNQMALNLQLNHDHKVMVEKISESVRQSLDLNEILNTAVLELGKALGASRCCLALVDSDHFDEPTGKKLEFNYVFGNDKLDGTPLKNRSVSITEGSILKIILEQSAILSLDVMDDSTFGPIFDQSDDSPEDWKSIKSLIACPIILDHRPIGMILVHQCDRRRVWLELELELVEAVARHVALALDHAHMYTRTRQMAEQQFLINQIVRSTRDSLDPDTILNTVTEEIMKALHADYCQIAQPRREGPLVITHECARPGMPSHKGLSLYGRSMDFHPSDEDTEDLRSVLGIDLSLLEPGTESATNRLQEVPLAVIPDVASDRRTQNFAEFLGEMGSRSLIAAPLLREGRVLGILIVHQVTTNRDWQVNEVRLLAAVADQLSVAVSHAQLFEQVQHQAITDGLTGLYNHVYFKNRLDQELSRAQRKGTHCSLLMLDLDKLKQINDTFGHPVGDAAIRQVSDVLKSLLRSGDTAARYGGEEFAVILPETPLSEAVLIADRLRSNIHRNAVPGLGFISTSIGAAVFPAHAGGVSDLVDKADKALYVAKRTGRNRVCVWDEDGPLLAPMEEESTGRQSDENSVLT